LQSRYSPDWYTHLTETLLARQHRNLTLTLTITITLRTLTLTLTLPLTLTLTLKVKIIHAVKEDTETK